MSYSREQIRIRLEKKSSDMSLFYKGACINYRGKTSDTKEYYTEVIAEWLLKNLDLLEQIKTLTRCSSYSEGNRTGIPTNPDSSRTEELIAMAMKKQKNLSLIGRVLDYQVPLKNVRSDKAGKIDILTYDNTTLRILELKKKESKETMLRCVLEGYTYMRMVDKTKLLKDFNLPATTVVEACPFVFRNSCQWKEMQQDRPNLKRLMVALNSKPYYIVEENGIYKVTEN